MLNVSELMSHDTIRSEKQLFSVCWHLKKLKESRTAPAQHEQQISVHKLQNIRYNSSKNYKIEDSRYSWSENISNSIPFLVACWRDLAKILCSLQWKNFIIICSQPASLVLALKREGKKDYAINTIRQETISSTGS